MPPKPATGFFTQHFTLAIFAVLLALGAGWYFYGARVGVYLATLGLGKRTRYSRVNADDIERV